jgi:hypothetical protein
MPQKRVEEPVWWHAESPLIERHKGNHVPIRRGGECRVLRHTTSLELHHRHEPVLHKFLQVALRNDGRSPILLRHGSSRKGKQHLRGPGIFFLFPSFLLSPLSTTLSFFRRREGGRERTVDGAKGYRGAQGRSLASNPMASMVKQLGPLRCSKGLVN